MEEMAAREAELQTSRSATNTPGKGAPPSTATQLPLPKVVGSSKSAAAAGGADYQLPSGRGGGGGGGGSPAKSAFRREMEEMAARETELKAGKVKLTAGGTASQPAAPLPSPSPLTTYSSSPLRPTGKQQQQPAAVAGAVPNQLSSVHRRSSGGGGGRRVPSAFQREIDEMQAREQELQQGRLGNSTVSTAAAAHEGGDGNQTGAGGCAAGSEADSSPKPVNRVSYSAKGVLQVTTPPPPRKVSYASSAAPPQPTLGTLALVAELGPTAAAARGGGGGGETSVDSVPPQSAPKTPSTPTTRATSAPAALKPPMSTFKSSSVPSTPARRHSEQPTAFGSEPRTEPAAAGRPSVPFVLGARKPRKTIDFDARAKGPEGPLVGLVPPKRKPGSVTVTEYLANGGGDADGFEALDERAIDAARWTDKSVTQLIEQVVLHGEKSAHGQVQVKFGTLFEETADIFDALVGLLKTARKYGVLHYHGDAQLWQGKDDRKMITLIKTEWEGVVINRRATNKLAQKSAGVDTDSLRTQQAPCAVCSKTVYQNEFVGASGQAFHKSCFRCKTCNKILSQNDYSVAHDRNFRCTAHHREFELAGL
jgi:phage FluMu protein Com